MATNTVYISAGLSVSKDAAVKPTANTVYISAGLSPEVVEVSLELDRPVRVRVKTRYE